MKVTKAYVIEVTLEELLGALENELNLITNVTSKQYQLVQLDQQNNGNLLIEVEEIKG